ncbi:MAG: ATP-grasp domain-containing protein [Candidatus Brockarchaeota archaeon]|nr:ATP-grasp domain-containing protein [Candidatus Brockarchaeota archaeon]
MGNIDSGLTIAVLTHKPYSYSSIRLREEAGKLGVDCQLVSFSETALLLKEGIVKLNVFHDKGVRKIFSRPKTLLRPILLYALSLTRILEEEGFYVVNPFKGFMNTLDKMITYRNLCMRKLPVPDSILTPSRESVRETPPPFFLKPIYGSRGRGVKLVESVNAVSSLEAHGAWVIQAPARDADWDLRVLVLNGNVLAAMKRVSNKHVTNVSQGGFGEAFKGDGEVAELAVNATEALSCVFAGVDVSFKNGEAFILDVNPQPDFMGVEEATGVNVAREIIRHMLSNAGE